MSVWNWLIDSDNDQGWYCMYVDCNYCIDVPKKYFGRAIVLPVSYLKVMQLKLAPI